MRKIIGVTVGTPLSVSKIEEKIKPVKKEYVDNTFATKAAVARNDKRIANLESGTPPELFVTDSTVAYVKDVPEDVLPYAEVTKLGGKSRKRTNLIPFPYADGGAGESVTILGVTYTVNADGSVKRTGTANGYSNFSFSRDVNFKAGETYTASAGVIVSVKSNGETKYLFNTFVWEEGYTLGNIYTQVANTTVDDIVYPMLNSGSTALPYEPYFEGLRSAPVTEVESVGKNLIPLPHTDGGAGESVTILGVTYTVNADGSVKRTGTANGYSNFSFSRDVNFKAGETYTASAGVIVSVKSNGETKWLSNTFVWKEEYTLGNIYTQVNPNVAVDDTIYPMINKGSVALEYTPYTKRSLPIPEAVQALDGYGWGVNESVYNYIDFEKEQFVKRVGKAASVIATAVGTHLNGQPYCSLYRLDAKSNGAVLSNNYTSAIWTDKDRYVYVINGAIIITDTRFTSVEEVNRLLSEEQTEIYYELATPEITDISDILPADNYIGVEGGGTLTFKNEHKYKVPSEVTYQIKEAIV